MIRRRRNRNKKHSGLSRRRFLQGLGGSALALPFLEYFSGPGTAYAADSLPKRLIVIAHHQGWVPDDLIPGMSGGQLVLGDQLAACEPFKDRLTVLSGVENTVRYANNGAKGHSIAPTSLFTQQPFAQNLDSSGSLRAESNHVEEGTPGGPSFEQVIGERLRSEGQRRSINLNIGRSVSSTRSYFADARDAHIESDPNPRNVFDSLFGMIDETDPALVKARDIRTRTLDKVGENLRKFEDKLGSEDRQRLQAHTQYVDELESRLRSESSMVCTQPDQLAYPDGFNARYDIDVSATNQIDMLVMALSCGMSQVGTLYYSDASPRFPFINGVVPSAYDSWHDMIHDGPESSTARPGLLAGFGYLGSRLAYLMERLDSIPDGDGTTMLDNTLIVWGSEFDTGARHRSRDLLFVVAGGMGLKGNNYVDYTDTGKTPADLYTAAINAFGFDDSSFGYQGMSTGPMSELFI